MVPIIVAGKLILKPQSRDKFIDGSREAILLARQNTACTNFSVSPDPIDMNRINIFEQWQNRQELEAFRKLGPESNIFSLVESFDVNEYEVNS